MVTLLAVIAVLATVAVVYFAFESSRIGRIAEELEAENADLRGRLAVLVGELRRLRESSGLVSDSAVQSLEDELMPLRRVNRAPAKKERGTRNSENPDLVALISADPAEQKRVSDALQANSYRVTECTLADAPRFAHELSTAALIFDLRNLGIATGARVMLPAFANDPLAKEVPVFAIVGSNLEKERLVDEGIFTAVFLAPADTALLVSNLGAAIIRRRTRAQRAEAARSLSSAVSRP